MNDRPLFRCESCGNVSHILRESVYVMPRLCQVRFTPSCGCIHVRAFPARIIVRLANLAEQGYAGIHDVQLPVMDETKGPRITVAETLEAAEDFDRWFALQMLNAQ